MTLRFGPPAVLLGSIALLLGAADDARPDTITATCAPGPCGAWQRAAVRVDWVVDVPSRASDKDCGRVTLSAEGRHQRTCEALAGDGTPILSSTVTVLIDATPPQVNGVTLIPAANPLGWQTAPLTASFLGSDPGPAGQISGLASCAQIGYAGPDTSAASVQGTCRDGAGNVSAPFTHAFKYDATTPVLAPLAADADDRVVTLRWTRSEGPIELARAPGIGDEPTSVVYRGAAESFVDRTVKNGTTYRYQATVTDAAGNAAAQSIAARPFRGLEAPAEGARLAAPPRLTWTKVQNAAYYNVQVYRGGKKILSVWPTSTTFALKRSWRYQGTRYRAVPGTYRVFVWPGIGPFAKQRYGRIVGSRTFVVVRG